MGRLGQPFRPAFIDDVTAMILQFAMFRAEAEWTLTDNLAPFYNDHKARYAKTLGVEVTIGNARSRRNTGMNGLYRRREPSDPMPLDPELLSCSSYVRQHRTDRPWYEKDDGWYIYYGDPWSLEESWRFAHKSWSTSSYLIIRENSALPPAGGWDVSRLLRDPRMTLRV